MPKASKAVAKECWCGCGKSVSGSGDFAHGHDVKAALEAIIIDWGSVQKFIELLGYGPGMNDASLDVTYHEHMAKKTGRTGRKRRPAGMKVS